MRGNEEKKQMEDLEVNTILALELQMKNKSLNDNYKSEELVFLNEMDHEVQNEKFVMEKSEVGISVLSVDSLDVWA